MLLINIRGFHNGNRLRVEKFGVDKEVIQCSVLSGVYAC